MLCCYAALSKQSEAAKQEATEAPGEGAGTEDGIDVADILLENVDVYGSIVVANTDAFIDAQMITHEERCLSMEPDDDIGPSSPVSHSASVVDESIIVETSDFDGNAHDYEGSNDSNDQQQELQYTPPTHFQISAHIQTNLHTGYSYFLLKESLSTTSLAHLPFLECGAIGYTTESLPLVCRVFCHVPHISSFPKHDEITMTMDIVLKNLEQQELQEEKENVLMDSFDMLLHQGDEGAKKTNQTTNINETANSINKNRYDNIRQLSPPKCVVALSSMEITVGGSGNETQKIVAGDVIFIEDTWWGVWDFDISWQQGHDDESSLEEEIGGTTKMKGFLMHASPEFEEDLNVLMLTIPNAIYRQ